MNNDQRLADVVREFQIAGELKNSTPYGSGHINDTYCAVFEQDGRQARFIVQRINRTTFTHPEALMENVERVTRHLAAKSAGAPDSSRHVTTLIASCSGRAWHVDASGSYWRVFQFIEHTRAFDRVQSTEQAFEAAKAFGRFQQLLADLPAPQLHDTIPDFHNTPKRFALFEKAIAADVVGRAGAAQREIEFALHRRSMASLLLDANLPQRVTHNDAKLNNVLLDEATGEGLCVIDLDTVMMGLAPYDFGDMVRTMTSASDEDERDLSKIDMQFPMFDALVRGYLATAGDFLTEQEKLHLVYAGKLITFEQGIRFLTDHLAGDTYYKVHREGHNLDRCRTQFKLVESIELQEAKMHALMLSLS